MRPRCAEEAAPAVATMESWSAADERRLLDERGSRINEIATLGDKPRDPNHPRQSDSDADASQLWGSAAVLLMAFVCR